MCFYFFYLPEFFHQYDCIEIKIGVFLFLMLLKKVYLRARDLVISRPQCTTQSQRPESK